MTTTNVPLEVLRIESPCPADWSKMTGDNRSRFCNHCQKHVHNLTQMTRSEAEELVCRSAGNLCVQFARDTAGTVITLDYAKKPSPRRWTVRAAMVAALASAGSMLGIIAKPPAQMLRGEIAPVCLPTPTTQPAPPAVVGKVAPK